MSGLRSEWPLWEVFVRPQSGLDHKHCGSLHASDAAMAVQLAREVYARRQEGTSLWVVRSSDITASDPGDKAMYFDPMADKVYRHPSFYVLPESVDHM
ncbi:MAG: 1,2-phenylacetyl-CoA epoxidase subunit B [Burkholderiales bacterium]|nr:1,2-phenylacetyl-CoA epoxidase subunit B [Burkholderiales bacterium]MDE2275828.1 1,2-phenylacetyl-CoA epoxidase subunit B [Burkholderiales bacterium]